jgi:hypothetical protein
MKRPPEPTRPAPQDRRIDELLDEALEESFPASDPPSMLQPHELEETPEAPVRR